MSSTRRQQPAVAAAVVVETPALVSKINEENDMQESTMAREKQILDHNLKYLRSVVSSIDEDNWMFHEFPKMNSSNTTING